MSEAGKTESSTLPARFSGHRLAVWAGAGLVVVSVAYIAVHWDSFAQGPVVQGTGIWDQLLGTQEVAIAIRLAIVAGAVYVVASVVGLILQGRWLTKIRGAEVDPASSAEKQLEGLESLDARATSLEEAVEEMRSILTSLIQERLRPLDGLSGDG